MTDQYAMQGASVDGCLLQDLDKNLSSSSTIFAPVQKIRSSELYLHLRAEERMAYRHFVRAISCYHSLNRMQSRLIEDMQDVLCISEKEASAEENQALQDPLVLLMKEKGIAESRKTFEYDLEQHFIIANNLEKSSGVEPMESSDILDNRTLYGHYRREELLCYHYLVSTISCQTDWKRSQQRVLEDIEGLFCIPSERISLEKQMAKVDPVILLIKRNLIVQNRTIFEGRVLDNSYSQPDKLESEECQGGSHVEIEIKGASAYDQEKESSIDRLCMEAMMRKQKFSCQKLSQYEWSLFLDAALSKISSMKRDIQKGPNESEFSM